METREEFQARIQDLMKQADKAIKEANDYLIRQGEVIDLAEWVTIKEYCRRFGIKNTETVSNWIKRGIVPEDDTLIIEEFNNIRMIRAKPYRTNSKLNVERASQTKTN
ncbi:hypothetical protein J2Y45_003275 [Dyadobacter sp. BE34]|uniref:Helix-turn-helix domain-containing protein n=1 Tax=Dyadobacter fermentans TaxID=94254 RepID=A0ABU1QY37_9BACT|nr:MULTISPECIES: hypothetical protein [Dyadobacter]MDR6806083.1 hypothetical protein [Dyadobacter fermentans]MDR7043824.1 hypothetical protein [Dyadobacter sp. BE242]MDR7198135.1 hypothetical protein [Dyadobacter sp. BE34]MDR7216098.1 hypothetical protein [Dyadobacter sp. BE31]MDR7264376.1 hypothetical protein [Dyadobacter sp. BE32]